MTHVFFVLITLAILIRAYRAVRSGTFYRVTASTVASLVYATSLWVPGLLQASGELTSKLTRAGVLGRPSWREFDELAAAWSLELVVVVVAEAAIVTLVGQGRRGATYRGPCFRDYQGIAYACLAVGAVALLMSEQTLETRGQYGNGVNALLSSFFVSGLAILAYFLPPGKAHRAALVLGTVVLSTSYVRSPLIVIGIALAVGALHRGRLRSRTSIGVLLVSVMVFVLIASTMSAIRGSLLRDQHVAPGEQVRSTVSEPLLAPFRSGVDTLDGYRFSKRLAPITPPAVSDPLMAVGSFVPRSVWSTKPDELSVRLSRQYLGYGASGQFLSPVGYLTLVTGGYVSAVLGLGAFVAILAGLSMRVRHGLWSVIVVVVLFRFLIGGAAFDIAYGLRLAIPWVMFGAVFAALRGAVGLEAVRGPRHGRGANESSRFIHSGGA